MFQGARIVPIAVRNDNILGFRTFCFHLLEGRIIHLLIRIAHIAQVLRVRAFDQTTAIKNFFLLKPNHNVVGRMPFPGIIRFKGIRAHVEQGIVFHQKFRAFLLVRGTQFVRHARGVGGNPQLLIILQPLRPIAVPMRGDAKDHSFVVPHLDAVQQGLKLRGVPGCVKKNNAVFRHHIHSVRGQEIIFIQIVGGVHIKISREGRNLEFCRFRLGKEGAGNAKKKEYEKRAWVHGLSFE